MKPKTESQATVETRTQIEIEIEQIYAYSPIGLFVFDRDYRFLRINEYMAEINGLSVADHAGKTLDDIVPELAGFLKEVYRPIFERGEPVLNVAIHGKTPKDPDHERDWIGNYFPLKSATGEVVGLMGAVLEITAQKRMEDEARRKQWLLDSIVAGTTDAIFVKDYEGRYLFINRAAADLVGKPVAEILGQDDTFIFPPDVAHMVRAGDRAIMAADATKTYEELIIGHSGSQIKLLTTKGPLHSATGAVVGIFGISRDITELSGVLRAAALGNFMSGVAHEVRNPLFGVLANLDALEDQPERAKEFIPRIRVEATRLSALMADLLEYGKPAAPALEPVEWAGVVTRAVQARACTVSTTICVETPEDLPLIQGDSARLEQALENLIQNAIAFSGTTGVRIVSRIEGEVLTCQVEDDGPGFSEEDMTRAFEPFYTRRKGGTGLGMAMVKRIIEDHGGSIELRNRSEGGAIVRIALPLTPGSRA